MYVTFGTIMCRNFLAKSLVIPAIYKTFKLIAHKLARITSDLAEKFQHHPRLVTGWSPGGLWTISGRSRLLIHTVLWFNAKVLTK